MSMAGVYRSAERMLTAEHEAAHAVLAELLGAPVSSVLLRGTQSGVVHLRRPVPPLGGLGVAILLAGIAWERLYGMSDLEKCESDLDKTCRILQEQFHVRDPATGARLITHSIVRLYRGTPPLRLAIEAVAEQLLRQRRMTGAEVRRNTRRTVSPVMWAALKLETRRRCRAALRRVTD